MTPWHAIFSFHGLLIVIVVVTLGYGLFVRRLAELVQPLRLQLAERGEKYLAVCKEGRERRSIELYLENALNPWIPIWGSVFLPFGIISQLVWPTTPNRIFTGSDEYRRIWALFTISSFAANPLFWLIIMIELTLLAILIIIFSGKLSFILRVVLALIERQAIKRAHHHVPAH